MVQVQHAGGFVQLHLAAQGAEDVQDLAHVGDVRHAVQPQRLIGQQRGAQDGQDRVLVGGRNDAAAQGVPPWTMRLDMGKAGKVVVLPGIVTPAAGCRAGRIAKGVRLRAFATRPQPGGACASGTGAFHVRASSSAPDDSALARAAAMALSISAANCLALLMASAVWSLLAGDQAPILAASELVQARKDLRHAGAALRRRNCPCGTGPSPRSA